MVQIVILKLFRMASLEVGSFVPGGLQFPGTLRLQGFFETRGRLFGLIAAEQKRGDAPLDMGR